MYSRLTRNCARRVRSATTAGCADIDPCRTPCICERLSTPSEEGYARIMLRGSTTLKTAVPQTLQYDRLPNVTTEEIHRELLRIRLARIRVNRAAKAHSSCPDSRMAALFFLSFRAGSGCNHSETWAGCIVCLTTLTKSSLSAFRSVSSRSFIENPSSVLAASYLLR